MAHLLVDGPVSDIQRGSETQGSGSSHRGTGSMHVSTSQLTSMRIGNQAVQLKSKHLFVVKEGERVIAAGRVKHGVLEIGAAHNVSAGTVYQPSILLGWIMVGLLLLIGIPFSLILIGVPFVVYAGYLVYVILGWQKSKALVEAAVNQAALATASAR
jgi:hypothetical protein